MKFHRTVQLPLLGLVLLLTSGCGGGGTSGTVVDNGPKVHMNAVVSLYNYAVRLQGHPPKNREDFEKFIDDQGSKVLEKLEIASAKELLISDRDGKEIVVVYKKPLQSEAGDVIAYESEGVGGIRNVGFALGGVQPADEEQFKKLVP